MRASALHIDYSIHPTYGSIREESVMKKVLLVLGTGGVDMYDLPDFYLKKLGIECVNERWDKITGPPGRYDLAILFGLADKDKKKAHLFAGTVRRAIGPNTKFLIVSKWNSLLITQEQMRELYDAEYFPRNSLMLNLVDVVLEMLGQKAKTAPC